MSVANNRVGQLLEDVDELATVTLICVNVEDWRCVGPCFGRESLNTVGQKTAWISKQ